ncbi:MULTISPECIES: FliM/FliN family flagellar motor switch protein [Myxococcus]|uniref:FliM/FliN family flagellar motor switch protein n=1 Tax=Myxococcus TaxID=32 RepID=UPI0011430C9C|nr:MULTISPECIES: FliM/FliN family flagellar motor switch protein [Myxococcus]MCK8497208.1 FliM/FliN family flagellar motor switch protein [Myxococcus fulvus]
MNLDTEPSIPPEPRRLRRLGARRMSRAHLVLAARPRVANQGRQALGDVCEALGRELGCSVTAEARLLDAVVSPLGGLMRPAVFVLLELSAVGGVAVLELEPALAIAALERIAGAGGRAGVVTELSRLEDATLAYLVLVGLSAVRARSELYPVLAPRLVALTMRGEDITARLRGRQPLVGVELRVTVGQVSAGARLLLPAPLLQSVFLEYPVERGASVAPEVLAASLELRCLVGRMPLTNQALDALAVGDVVVFEGVRRESARLLGDGRLVGRGFSLAGTFRPEGFCLTRAQVRAPFPESNMQASNERSNDAMPPLPVDVEVELTRVLVPLSELAALKSGVVLPLHINASTPVLLRVGDRVVARAELVDIEGEVGARILALLP